MSGLRVDRARFLALVGSIAATTCGTATTSGPPTTTPIEDSGAGADEDAAIEDAHVAVDAKKPDAGGDAGCEDDDGIAAGPCDSPFTNTFGGCATRSTCISYVSHFKSRVARNAIACHRAAIAADASCVDCARQALAKACPDPSGAATCKEAAAICSDAGKPSSAGVDARCAPSIAGLNAGGRYAFLSCATESGCANNLDFCLGYWR